MKTRREAMITRIRAEEAAANREIERKARAENGGQLFPRSAKPAKHNRRVIRDRPKRARR